MQQNLQNFNYEVFVSKTLLDMLLHREASQDIPFYPLILLSESLTNKEMKIIVPKLKEKNAVIFRKYISEPASKEKTIGTELAIDHWIPRDIGTDTLHELISEHMSTIRHELRETQVTRNVQELLMDFSTNQKKYFSKLQEAEAAVVSRRELCQYIWNTEPTQSNLAQLSALTKSLRQKLMHKGFPADIIETVWGKGYHLNKEFYQVYCDSIE